MIFFPPKESISSGLIIENNFFYIVLNLLKAIVSRNHKNPDYSPDL